MSVLRKAWICVAAAMVALPLLAACGDDEGDVSPEATTEVANTPAPTATPMPEVKLPPPVELGDGLRYETMKLGQGAPAAAGDVARLRLMLGQEDKPLFKGEFSFKIGSGQAIAGLDRAITGMKSGETRRITIPFPLTLDSGGRGIAGLPEGEDLLAEAEMLSIEPQSTQE